jgi:hypothetical protein
MEDICACLYAGKNNSMESQESHDLAERGGTHWKATTQLLE